ncbi:three-Cys-motif partner protein TcmP [Mitsuaria sp. CC2]|uniref:three-Cys-motif partner protein TcmP n=1 Tax=Mitsuaria sp. CC2 TaxID=3029186 RepID=UPI003B8DBA1B
MNKRTSFILPRHPDPCPGMPVERGPADEGVGWWVPEIKHTCLAKYIDGTRKAQTKFPRRVLIDPFCGPGRVQIKGEQDTRDGGTIVAWRQSVASGCPFTHVFVGDLDADRAEACEQRLRALGAPARRFVGPAAETVPLMVRQVPRGALCLAYLDPYNLQYLSFPLIEQLSRLKCVDFAVHFSLMDLTRNVDMELDPKRDRFAEAAPDWRLNMPNGLSKASLKDWFFDYWCGKIRGLGMTISDVMPLIESEGRAIYRLVFFSRNPFPERIWNDVAKSPNLSLPF